MEYILTKSDYEDIRILIAVSESIWESYEALANLEIEGKKGTIEYQRRIELLHSTRGMEPIIYGRLATSSLKVTSIIQYLKSTGNDCLKNDRLEVILRGQKKDIIIERIIRKLDQTIYLDKEFKQDVMSELKEHFNLEDDNDFSDVLKQHIDKNASLMNAYMEISSSMEEDKYAFFLSILRKIIESPLNEDIKAPLIMMKYRMVFISKQIEETMLKQGFEIPTQVYLRSTCIGQMEKQNDVLIAEILVKSSLYAIRSQTAVLLGHYSDSVLSYSDKKVEALVRLAMLRAGLLFLTPDCVYGENEIFHDIITSEKYLKERPNNFLIENFIRKAYRQYHSDKSIPIQVSFTK